MELDELKQQWDALNQHLAQAPLTDRAQIEKLIATYRTKTNRSLGGLKNLQRVSLTAGAVLMGLMTLALLLLGINSHNKECFKYFLLSLFITITLIGGMVWDWRTYSHLRTIRVDITPVAEVSRCMVVFRRWMKYEVWACSLWAVLFTLLIYWGFGYYQHPPVQQIILLSLILALDISIIYFYYKKLVYKYLDDIKKNIEELKDICTESH